MDTTYLTALLVILVTVSAMPSVYAQSFLEPKENFVFGIKNIIQDIIITISPEEKRGQLIADFAKQLQTEIDDKSKRGEVISLDIEERRKELLNKEVMGNKVINLQSVKDEIASLGEMNEIRILYSQFPDCIKTCTDTDKQRFNDRVNSLETWKNKCSGTFDINNYKFNIDSFDKLSEQCPELKNYSHKHLRTVVSGVI